MKKGKKDFLMLKRILAITFIITLLSNHIMILGEIGNIALATELEWQSEFTSDVKNESAQENETNSEESNITEENQNSVVPDSQEDSSTGESSEDGNEENNAQIPPENDEEQVVSENNEVDLNDEEVVNDEAALSEEEIEAINQITANTELDVNKLIRFDNESGKGILVDTTLKLTVDTKDINVDNVNVNFELPNISGILPYTYRIEEISENIVFNQEEGTNNISLNIDEVVNNYEEEVRLILVYSEQSFTGTELKLSGNVKITSSGYEISGNFEEVKPVEENLETIATYQISADTPSKYKGYLYANTMVASKKDIPYATTDVVEIEDSNFIDEIIVQNNVDKFVTDLKEIDLTALMAYKSTSISVEEFNAVLGKEGSIEIYDQSGDKIGEINSDSEVKNDRYYFYYNTQIDNVIFRLKNIESNGTLNIKNNKVIKGTDTFSREHIDSFKSIKSETVSKVAKIFDTNEVIVQSVHSENNINLEETESKMTLKMDTTDFVTTEENNVTFEVTLKTDEEKYELFRNPVVSIELPSAVENVEIQNVNLMYKNGLSLNTWQVVKNAQGLNEIQVSLAGTQEEYMPSDVIEGTKILVTAKINLNRITANGKSLVKLRYENEVGTNKSYILEGNDSTDVEVNYVSRSGILKETKLQNFNDENEVLVTYEDEALTGKIDATGKGRTATVSTTIMNNYSDDITNVAIIGKIPSIGNTKDGADLNTTFDATISKGVNLNGLVGKVYYSNEENPDKDSSSWQENISDFSQVKSFKVVLDNNAMKVGEKVELSYNLNIPENVGYNATAYSLVTTYYDYNNQEIEDSSILGLESEIKAISLEDCQVVESTPQLSIGTQVTKGGYVVEENEEINEGQILRYNVVISNNSNTPITNINLKGYAENSNSYYFDTYYTENSTDGEQVLTGEWKEDVDGKHLQETTTIESIAPGETKVFSYQVKVKHLENISSSEIYGKIYVSADGIQEKEYQTIKNKIINAKVELSVARAGLENVNNMDTYTLDMYNLSTKVKNISDTDLQNVKVNVMIPSLLKYEPEETDAYNSDVVITEQDVSNGKMITFTILNLPKGETKNVVVATNIGSIDLNIAETQTTIVANATIDEQLHLSNEYTRTIKQGETSLNVNYTANRENESIVKNGDDIKYTINIQNTGIANGYVDFTDYLPYGLNINSVKLSLPDGTQQDLEVSEYNYVMTDYTLAPAESMTIEIDSVVDISDLRTNQSNILNRLEIIPDDHLNEIEEIVYYIDPADIDQLPNDGAPDDEEINDNTEDQDNRNTTTTETQDNENTSSENTSVEDNNQDLSDTKNENTVDNTDNNEEDKNIQNANQNNNDISNNENNANSNVNQSNESNSQTTTQNGQNSVNAEQNIDIQNVVDSVKYSISGKAWLDKNKNGIFDDEELLSSVKVMLVKSETDDTTYINDSNIVDTVNTNDNGEYIFNNLSEGKYVVIFDYDNTLYEVTSYQANGKSDSKSSDVISRELKLNGDAKKYAVSDMVNVSNRNITNIDAGLKESSDFDMAITSYVRKITTVNEKGTQTDEFDEYDRIAKVEIASKYLNSSNVTIEYIVKVTNNGKTSGYVNQIAEYIPEGLTFDANSNTDWQLGEDGSLYTSALNKVLIAAGESKEITLVLTKKMTENDTGIYKNTAKIVSSTNDLQLSDADENNNTSEVEVIIGVKTGAIYYILVIVIALAIAFIAMLVVSKLIKDDKEKVNLINKIIIIVSLIIIVALCLVIKTYAAYNMGTLSTCKLNTFFTTNYSLNSDTLVPANYGSLRTLQCVEGSNVSGAIDWHRRVVSVADITGLKYSTKSIKGRKSSSSQPAGVLAYMAYKAEDARVHNRGSAWDYKQLLVGYIRSDRSSVNSVLNVSINGGSNAGHLSSIVNEGKQYAKNLASSGGGVKKNDGTVKLQYNSSYNGFGAIYATFPTNAKLEIYTGSKWVTCSKVVTSKGTVNFNYNNCNNKAFYIPMSVVENYDLNKVKVKISANIDVYKARIVATFSNDNSTQNQAVIRGKVEPDPSEIEYKIEAIADLTVTKTVYSDRACRNQISGSYMDRGDIVYFKVSIQNKGANTTCDITDTYNTNQFECLEINDKAQNPNGSLKQTININKNTTSVFVFKMRVKNDVSANVNTQLTNTARISEFKISNKTVPNKTGNRTTDSDYVKCKQYRISASKGVAYITSASGAPKSTTSTVEVGDIITYRITVKNNGGSKSSAYGTIKYKLVENIPSGFQVTSSGTNANWRAEGNNYVYNGEIASGGTTLIDISMVVTPSLLNTQAVNKKNTVEITNITNKNGVDVKPYVISSTLKAECTVKILGYNMSVSKAVTSINDGAVANLTQCELGDKITYTIQVKNTGANSANYGSLYKITLQDVFKSNELEFISATGSGWIKDSNTQYTYNGPLAPGQTATLTLNLKVILESKQKVKITNTANVVKTYNKNYNENYGGNFSTMQPNYLPIEFLKNNFLITMMSSSATVEYQTYDMGVWKYISATDATNANLTDRMQKTNDEKYNSPVEVEKYNWVEYTIKVQNTGNTIAHDIVFEDIPENGLTYNSVVSAKKFNSSNQEETEASQNITQTMNGTNVQFAYADAINPGEYIEVKVKFDVTMSNMYLLNLKNEIVLLKLLNRNDADLVSKDLVNYTNYENADYVRLKNLIVSGKVWIDNDRNGKADTGEANLSGIQVILHDDTNKKVATTYTDADGNYKFGETNGIFTDGTEDIKKMVEGGNNSGRIVKATNRDDNTGNYNSNSSYINYYVEFYYNGAKYTSTVYSGKQNINLSDNSITAPYMTDSNAKEYSNLREAFNSSLETIEYNTGIAGIYENADKTNTKDISYTKDNHVSTVDLVENTAMSAYSFIIDGKESGNALINGNNIDMLFFSKSGETEYLKYINLGLQTREFDLDIFEDVDNVKTTVNGTEMSYFFNQGKVSNAPYGGEYVTGGESNPLNYQFRWYASDYYYKHDKYQNQKVVEYKQNTELNTEITYKITVTNNDVKDSNNVYTKIREIADYYSSDFVEYDPNNNTKVIKVMGEDGYLHEETINYVTAWYEYKDKSGKQIAGNVVISNESDYSEHANVNLNGKYNKLYLSGFDEIKLTQGESFDIYIKFVVDTEDGTISSNPLIGDKNNIVEINAYSTYFVEGDKPAGFVDKNSNPGNLGLRTESNKPTGTEGTDIEDYSQYENDTYKTGVNTNILEKPTTPDPENPDDPNDPDTPEEGTLERVIKGTVWNDARSETVGDGGNTQYIGNGEMNIGSDAKNPKAASNSKKDSRNRLIHDESTDIAAEGINAELIEIVRVPVGGTEYTYEEKALNTWSDAITSTRSTADGSYRLESFIPGEYVIRFNYGEDVEDVAYNGQEYKSTKYYNIDNEITEAKESGDNVLKKLEEPGKSDARDDEIRRLDVIRYSEAVNNRKTEEAQKQEPAEYSETFMKNTNMNAETVGFPIRAEKTTYEVKEFSFEDYIESVNNNIRYKIENIDFGVEYRPEVNVSINEFLSDVKLTTTDGTVLVDIKFDNVYETDENGNRTGNIIETVVNKETSIGFENLQYLPTVEDVKGLAYLNVDVDLLQGCTVDITYVFSVSNESEIDRISSSLYNLRYKADSVGYEAYYDDVYTAAGTAKNELYDSYYNTDENGAVYRTKDKIGTTGYYGKYLGSTYYSGNIGNDVISKLKVDMILDYVDNNMTMVATKNAENDKYWRTMTNDELREQGLIGEEIFKSVEEKIKENGQAVVKEYKQLIDAKGITYDVDTRHNLAVSVDDKISSADNENMNKSLSKFLTPYVSNPQESSGNIYMVASKVVSGESDTENMTYDNSAEIIQYTSSTGRVTRLGTTVGNLDMSTLKPNYDEPDSDFTERVTLTPPTGLEKTKYYMSLAKDQLIMVSIAIAVVIVAIILKRSLKNVTFKKFYK